MEEPFPCFLFQSEDTMQFLSWARPFHFSPAGTGLQDSSAIGVFSICGLLLVTEQNPPMSVKGLCLLQGWEGVLLVCVS